MPTLANMGVPMLFVVAPVLVLAFLPIVMLEAGIYLWRMKLPFRRALHGALWANLGSTLLGVPLTWMALFGVQLLTGGGSPRGNGHEVLTQAAWLLPLEPGMRWMIPAAAMVLHVPFFLASALNERLVLARLWKDADRRALTRACWLANACSYAGLLAFWWVQFERQFEHAAAG